MATVSRAVGMASVGHLATSSTAPPSATKPIVMASVSGFTATESVRACGRTIGLGRPTRLAAACDSSTNPPSTSSSTRSFTVERDNPVLRVSSERDSERRRWTSVSTPDRLRRRTSSVLVPILTILP